MHSTCTCTLYTNNFEITADNIDFVSNGFEVFNHIDTLDLSDSGEGISIDLNKTTQQTITNITNTVTLTFVGFENLIGTAYADIISKTNIEATNNIISNIDLGTNTDGVDIVKYDTVDYTANSGRYLNIVSVADTLQVSLFNDLTEAKDTDTNVDLITGLEELLTGSANDRIDLSNYNHAIEVTTGAGDDTVIGSLQNETINLGAGNDTYTDSLGLDIVIGDIGDDTFILGQDITEIGIADVIDGGDNFDTVDYSKYTSGTSTAIKIDFNTTSTNTNVGGVDTTDDVVLTVDTVGTAAATFSVTAADDPDLGDIVYQWQSQTASGTRWTNISGATSASLARTELTTSDNGRKYRVKLTSTAGAEEVISDVATLTVDDNNFA